MISRQRAVLFSLLLGIAFSACDRDPYGLATGEAPRTRSPGLYPVVRMDTTAADTGAVLVLGVEAVETAERVSAYLLTLRHPASWNVVSVEFPGTAVGSWSPGSAETLTIAAASTQPFRDGVLATVRFAGALRATSDDVRLDIEDAVTVRAPTGSAGLRLEPAPLGRIEP